MNRIREKAINQRIFLPKDLQISSWQSVEPFFVKLEQAPLNNQDDLKKWLLQRSELDAVMEEDKAWLYIQQSCHTDNKEHARDFAAFVQEIEEPYTEYSNKLNLKLLDFCKSITIPAEYTIFIRSIQKQTELFREENVRLLSELEVEEQKYGAATGAMTIDYKGEEITLQQAQNYLKSTNRDERKEVFELTWNRRSEDYSSLNNLLTSLLKKRHTVAKNAGYKNYLEYRFDQLGRFDYTIDDCKLFHASVEKQVVPLLDQMTRARQDKLGIQELMPYDLDVDVEGKEALKPFSSIKELIKKTISCYAEIDKQFGEFISLMNENGYLDLDSRKGKAPGGYNYPLHESNVPFIFMNATNNLRDLETMMHEGGHAIHSFLSKDLEFVYYKETPAEIAEVASMAMELISMEHWHHFFNDEDELVRAKRSQLEGVLSVLPWVATVDKFQHWLYTHPDHSVEDRLNAWNDISDRFSSKVVRWDEYPQHKSQLWQKQIHLFQFPLYYIEYGIAQLGSIGIWKNYKEDPDKTIANYKRALSLGYSRTLPELYEAAGIKFDFSAPYIETLSEFVRAELNALS